MCLCNTSDKTSFSDILTFDRPLGEVLKPEFERDVETLAFQARVSTPPSGPSRC